MRDAENAEGPDQYIDPAPRFFPVPRTSHLALLYFTFPQATTDRSLGERCTLT